jgi:hypothetical protein
MNTMNNNDDSIIYLAPRSGQKQYTFKEFGTTFYMGVSPYMFMKTEEGKWFCVGEADFAIEDEDNICIYRINYYD